MYEEARTSVKMCMEKRKILGENRCSPGIGFESVFVFISYENTQDETLRCMMFTDNIVLIDESIND